MKILSLLLLALLTGCSSWIQPNLMPSPEMKWVRSKNRNCEDNKTNCKIDVYKPDTMSYHSDQGENEVALIPSSPKED